LEIAHELICKHKTLTEHDIYIISKKRLKLTHRGLVKILHFLINEKIIIFGSQYTKVTVINNPIRKKIYDSIVDHIGVNFTWIKTNVYLKDQANYKSINQFIWHLNLLIKFGLIKKIKLNGFTIFLPHNVNENIGKFTFLLRNELYYNIIKLYLNNEILEKKEIYKLINEDKKKVNYRIDKLLNYHVLMKVNNEQFKINSKNKILITKAIKLLNLDT